MLVSYKNSKLIVESPNVRLVNYPLDWISGLEHLTVDEISRLIFNEDYEEMDTWVFSSMDGDESELVEVVYKRRSYKFNHVTSEGKIASKKNKDSQFWRAIYYPDIGVYGRIGGATKEGIGNKGHPVFLKCKDPALKSGKFKSVNMVDSLVDASINLVFPFTLQVPPAQVTLNYFYSKGIRAIFSLGGPKGGQPLPKSMLGVGRTSDLGSTWYKHPKPYINERHAPGENFILDDELALAESHPAVIAILQQDEPIFTDIYYERFNYIKSKTTKPIFCTYNWGAFYNSNSPRLRLERSRRIKPISSVTDIYSNDPYIYTARKSDFKDFGDPKSNIWRLIDRQNAEISELTDESGEFDKPKWITLQGYGSATNEDPDDVQVPDSDFMFAQIWGAVCLGATGVAIYLMHNSTSNATNCNRRLENKNAPLIQGISPFGPNEKTWEGMKRAFKIIKKYESVLLEETIQVDICDNKKIITLIKQQKDQIYVFLLNCYRQAENAYVDIFVLPGEAWLITDMLLNQSKKVTDKRRVYSFEPFELKVLEVASVAV